MVNNVASEPVTGKDQSRGDPERHPPSPRREYIRDKMLDKTLADSFPTSDPPSSLPDPSVEDSFAEDEAA